jgi:LPS sulfotransferase NodH
MNVVQLSSHNPQAAAIARFKAPVFVVGSPRSGTTLLYHMLLSAGNFAVYRSETHIFSVFAPHYGNLRRRANRERMVDQWLRSKYFRLTGLNPEETRSQLLSECRTAGDFLRIVMENVASTQNVERWAENTSEHILYLREIKRTIPQALFIHMIRDGRDVALSLDKMGWVHPFPWDRRASSLVCGLYWQWMVQVGRKAGAALGANYLEVRYEDLVREPRQTLAHIGRFIGHDLDYDRILRVGIGSVRSPNTSFANAPGDDFNPIGRWKNGFSQEQLARFEALVGPFLEQLGYPIETPSHDLPSGFEIRRLRRQYLSYFPLRLWVKSHLPFAGHFVDIQWLRSAHFP